MDNECCKTCDNVSWCTSEYREPSGYCDDYKPKISAWELFRKLMQRDEQRVFETLNIGWEDLNQFYIELFKMLPNEFRNKDLGDWENTLTWLLSLNEQEAIEILQKIKGELE